MKEQSKAINKKDIAIIGMSVRFPQARNIDEFWKNLIDEREMSRFYSPEELKDLGLSEEQIKDPNYIPVDGSIADSDLFDYSFFDYTHAEAVLMDPQTRLLHQSVWHGLEDAGYPPLSYNGKIGLYLSASQNLIWQAHSLSNPDERVNPFFHEQIASKNFASMLISYKLNLKGPSVYSDTACSSSLTSIHLACRSIWMRECNIAVAGGASINSREGVGYTYDPQAIFSSDGHCRAFDKDATGTTAGDGVGIIILKRLEDAINDRDQVYAVIRSTAVNNDGDRKVGFTAPSVKGQAECIGLAQRIADVTPESISYVEAHGTATRMGDPIEIQALNKVFGKTKGHQCAIGTVKSNIGHLDVAAGVAGVVKTALSLKNKVLPASLNFKTSNPEINFDLGPFYVNAKTKEWSKETSAPRRAGVSSFGIGGTNAHVILEEAQEFAKGSESREFKLLTYSSKSVEAIQKYSEQLASFLKENGEVDLNDLAYTLSTGREAFQMRDFLVCNSRQQALDQLRIKIEDNHLHTNAKERPTIIFMFPGQGSQYYKMLEGIYQQEPFFKAKMDEGFDLFYKKTGVNFSGIIGYTASGEINDGDINQSLYTQPLIFLTQYALGMQLIEWGIQPDFIVGHSFGDYAAAGVGGAFSFEDGIDIVLKRAELTNTISNGRMVSVAAPMDTVAPILPKELSIATINTNDTCVVSGRREYFEDFIPQLEERDISYSILKIDQAGHSAQMDDISEAFANYLDKVEFLKLKYTLISNLIGKEADPDDFINTDFWIRHLRDTVNFAESVAYLMKKPSPVFIEVGTSNIMSGIVNEHITKKPDCVTVNLTRHPKEEINDVRFMMTGIGKLWSHGVTIDWKKFYEKETRNKISAPGYAFDGDSFPVKVNPFARLTNPLTRDTKQPISDWFYTPGWKKSILKIDETKLKESLNLLIFSDESPLVSRLVERLETDGHQVFIVNERSELGQSERTFDLDSMNEEHYKQLFSELDKKEFNIDQVIYTWEHRKELTAKHIINASWSVTLLLKKLVEASSNLRKITFLESYNQMEFDSGEENLFMGTARVLGYVMAQENQGIFASSIDIDKKLFDDQSVELITKEINHNYAEMEVAFRNGIRWEFGYQSLSLSEGTEEQYLTKKGVYLITGGLGYIGSRIADFLCEKHDARVILTGRSEITNKNNRNKPFLDENILSSKVKNLNKLKENGYQVEYRQLDISDAQALSSMIEQLNAKYGEITGIIHTAGHTVMDDFKPIEWVEKETIHNQFKPKVNGVLNLHNAYKDNKIGFVWMTSSLASIIGGLTYGPYAAANRFMDEFIEAQKGTNSGFFCVNLDRVGEGYIEDNELIELFRRSFSIGNLSRLVVSVRPLKNWISSIPSLKESAPQTSNSDKKPRPNLDIRYVAPSSEMEIKICEIWQDFFHLERVGIDDNFIEIGGDSLKAMSIGKIIYKEMNIEISLKDFYSKLTVREISKELEMAAMIKSVEASEDQNLNEITI